MKACKIKKPLTMLLLVLTPVSYGMTSEFFEGIDSNALKAGISKYLLTKGAKVYHNESYEADSFQAAEVVRTGKYSSSVYNYLFNLNQNENGTYLNVTAVKSDSGVDNTMEKKLIDDIRQSITGKFLYGLGFEFELYDSDNGKIKAPKGKEGGIKLTAVKYDALNKGLQIGDIIIEINDVPLSEIPIEKFATALFAKSINDAITLTYKRGQVINKVTLIPRVSNRKVF